MTQLSEKEIEKRLKEQIIWTKQGSKPIMRTCPICNKEKIRNKKNFQYRGGAWAIKCRECFIGAKKGRRTVYDNKRKVKKAVYDRKRNAEKMVEKLKVRIKEYEKILED